MKAGQLRVRLFSRSPAASLVAVWNRSRRPGQRVRYWTGPKDSTPFKGTARVQSRAFVDQGVAHIRLLGLPGIYPLARIEAID